MARAKVEEGKKFIWMCNGTQDFTKLKFKGRKEL